MDTNNKQLEVPKGIKFISILFLIMGIIFVLFPIIFFFISYFSTDDAFSKDLSFGVFILVGIVFIPFGLLLFFDSRGLQKGKKWARELAIFLLILLIVWSILMLVSSLTNPYVGGFDYSILIFFIITLLIAVPLLVYFFNPKVKELFSS